MVFPTMVVLLHGRFKPGPRLMDAQPNGRQIRQPQGAAMSLHQWDQSQAMPQQGLAVLLQGGQGCIHPKDKGSIVMP